MTTSEATYLLWLIESIINGRRPPGMERKMSQITTSFSLAFKYIVVTAKNKSSCTYRDEERGTAKIDIGLFCGAEEPLNRRMSAHVIAIGVGHRHTGVGERY